MDVQAVLLPLDGSELAEAALPYARALVRAYGGSLRLLGVVELIGEGLVSPTASTAAYLSWSRRETLQRYLARLAARERAAGLDVAEELREGRATDEILAAAEEAKASLIVMATHGRGGLRRLLIGSTADKVMRTSGRPVLLVSPAAGAPAAPIVQLRRLLVPLDGSPLAEAALAPAADLARRTGATLVLVQVKPQEVASRAGYDFVLEFTTDEDAALTPARDYLRDARALLPESVPVATRLLRGPVASSLVEFAHDAAIDLTIMTTHGLGGVKRLLVGSVADRVVRLGLSVLLIPPAAEVEKATPIATVTERA